MVNYIAAETELKDTHITLVVLDPALPEPKVARLHEVLKNYNGCSFACIRTGMDLFGVSKDKPVILFNDFGFLRLIRDDFLDEGIKDESTFQWTPHITLNMEQTQINLPKVIQVTRIYISIQGKHTYA